MEQKYSYNFIKIIEQVISKLNLMKINKNMINNINVKLYAY